MTRSTSRQRFHAAMGYGCADRVPLFDEGMRDDVIECWQKQGLPADVDPFEMFGCDRRERLPVEIMPLGGMKTRPYCWDDLKKLEKAYDAADAKRRPTDWAERCEKWRNREHVLELFIHRGLYQTAGMSDWDSVEQVFMQFADEPELIKRVMGIYSEFAIELVKRVLSEVEVDLVSFSDPIGTTHGALISPKMYREMALESYRPIMEAVRAMGVQTICFITYANARMLLDEVVGTGFNCLWAMETEAAAMDYRAIRKTFGPEFGLIGGVDLDAVIAGGEAMRCEVEQKVPELLASGRYIPLADGRIRSTVTLERYREYRRMLESVVGDG